MLSGAQRGRLLSETRKFMQELDGRVSDAQKAALAHVHEVRGDLMLGLGAQRRALTEYHFAETLGYNDAVFLEKARRVASGAAPASKVVEIQVSNACACGKVHDIGGGGDEWACRICDEDGF